MKFTQIIKMCLNYKVLLVVLSLIMLVYILAPRYANFSWILLALVCPLSMVLMMAGMQSMNKKKEDHNHMETDNNTERTK